MSDVTSKLVDLTPQWIAALCVWREARGESAECQRAVYWTIHNRMMDRRWPATLSAVVLQKNQFTSFSATDPNAVKFPVTPADAPSWESCCAAVEQPGTDPTGGACYYESFPDDQIEEVRKKQTWFNPAKLTVKIGRIRFYAP